MKKLVIGAAITAAILSLPALAMDRSDSVFDTKISKTIAIDNATAVTVIMDGEQDKGTPEGRKIEIERETVVRRANGLGDMAIANSASGMSFFRSSGKLVKNAPYSAEVISESQQKLADGNMISNKSSTLTYRDSQGRTREEIRDGKGELREVIINDPAEGHIVLNPKTKVATKLMDKFLMTTKSNGEALKVVTENITRSKDGKDIVELKLSAGDAKDLERHVIVRRVEKAGSDVKAGDSEKTLTVNVRGPENGRTMEIVMPGMSGNGAMNASLANVFGDAKWASKRQTKALGSKDFDGIKAEGKQSSFEIPAGEIGNTNPIVVSDETWFSPDLQITVYSKHSDPRSGDRIYRLSNIKRDDIAASMFAVPSDYKMRDIAKDIKDAKEIREIRMKREDKKEKE
ncbi:hypothetical protein [Undibacterium sp. Di24W]|uniref:hypothetical protein n=1 Tax=Undibacterium sp. Di24W TaxID=3413033 RepID=UPI003BF08529